jgi:hypothetical protein
MRAGRWSKMAGMLRAVHRVGGIEEHEPAPPTLEPLKGMRLILASSFRDAVRPTVTLPGPLPSRPRESH